MKCPGCNVGELRQMSVESPGPTPGQSYRCWDCNLRVYVTNIQCLPKDAVNAIWRARMARPDWREYMKRIHADSGRSQERSRG